MAFVRIGFLRKKKKLNYFRKFLSLFGREFLIEAVIILPSNKEISFTKEHGMKISKHIYSTDNYEYITIPNIQSNKILEAADYMKECKYDSLGQYGLCIPFRKMYDKFSNSSFIATCLKVGGCVHLSKYNTAMLSINDLYNIIKEANNGTN